MLKTLAITTLLAFAAAGSAPSLAAQTVTAPQKQKKAKRAKPAPQQAQQPAEQAPAARDATGRSSTY